MKFILPVSLVAMTTLGSVGASRRLHAPDTVSARDETTWPAQEVPAATAGFKKFDGAAEEHDDEEHQWPVADLAVTLDRNEEEGYNEHGRELAAGDCGIFADDSYFHPEVGNCYNLGGNWWNDRVTHIRASSDTCIDVYEHHEGGHHQQHCGGDWLELGSLSRGVSRVCCSAQQGSTGSAENPLSGGCNGNGGACGCGLGGDGTQLSMNRFFGDNNDETVFGCGGAFRLDGASLDRQWGGSISSAGPVADTAISMGLSFSQDKSYDGWEGCCYICGANLQLAGKISDGWYCQKDAFSTGIWLKGKNK